MPDEARLLARGIEAGYPGSGPALRDVSFAAHRGELLAVLGPNGAGKSTLLRVLSGTLAPRAGSLALGGLSMASLSRRDIARQIAFVPQRSPVPAGFRVREVVAMGRAPFQGAWLGEAPEDRARVDEALERCELGPLAGRLVEELSGGEQRRVDIARALAQGAPTLLLDEPGAHLDLRHAHALYRLLRAEVKRLDLTAVAALHDLNAASQNADRVLLLDRGRLVACGTPPEVMTPARLSQLFGLELVAARDEGGGTRVLVPRAPG